MVYSHNRSKKAKQRRAEIRKQKQSASHFIHCNQHRDLVTGETVNSQTQSEVIEHLNRTFNGVYMAAVPNVDPGDVLDTPTVYHLELY